MCDSRITRIRLAILLACLVLASGLYFVLLLGTPAIDIPHEDRFGGEGEHRVRLYVELIGVDALRDAMQVRVTVEPSSLAPDGQPVLPDSDLVLVLAHDQGGEQVAIRAHQSLPSTTIELNLDGGDITFYPLDSYRASLTVRCFDPSAQPGAAPVLLPVGMTLWGRILGFRMQTEAETGRVPGEQRLNFSLHRSRAFVFFALAAYGAMLVLACGAIIIGTLAFLRIRRPEPSMVGALGAIVFALPALRNALPGAPPLGVSADIFVFLWAELVAVFALALLVTTWARSGPPP